MPLRICKTIGPQGASGSGQVVFGDGVWALSLGLAVYCGSDLAFAWRLSLGAVPDRSPRAPGAGCLVDGPGGLNRP